MKFIFSLILVLFIFNQHSLAQGIFDASIHQAVPIGIVSSPVNEGSQQIIDQDPMTKFLDFDISDGMGFEVDLLGEAHAAASIEIVTANDAPERDPISYEIFGSNDGIDYISITTGVIPCVLERFLSRVFTFDNSTAYSFYRVNFTGTCNSSTILQVADVQLFTTVGNAPTISCPGDIAINNFSSLCEGLAIFDVTANDPEDGSLAVTQTLGPASGANFPLGITPVVFTAEDSDGNMVSCEFTVTVSDAEPPTFDCPEDYTIELPDGVNEVMAVFDVLDFDNCSNINPIDGFTALGTINGKSYYLSNNTFTVDEAIAHSVFTGNGILGTIRSAEDNDYLLSAILRSGFFGPVLIGYTDFTTEGVFEWINGDLSTFSNWNIGEPNNSGPGGIDEDYTAMLQSGLWNDVAATEVDSFRYLLETDYVLPQIQGLPSNSALTEGNHTNIFLATDLAGNTNTCEFTITVGEATGIYDEIFTAGIEIFPNPTESYVVLSNNSSIPMERITIYDLHGKRILELPVDSYPKNLSIDLIDLHSGIYFMEFKGQDALVRKKLLKQ